MIKPMKTKANDLNLTLFTFCNLFAVKCTIENYSNFNLIFLNRDIFGSTKRYFVLVSGAWMNTGIIRFLRYLCLSCLK